MLVWLNGRFVPKDQAVISAFDRGFVYGDGIFETIPIHNGQPFRWNAHLERFQTGTRFLKISAPFSSEDLRQSAQKLVELNGLKRGVVRIVLSRGTGARGYSPKGAEQPTCVITSHELPSADLTQCRVVTSSYRVTPDDTLTRYKTCNKLPQVLARAEADEAGADEALLLNTRGEAVTATAANLFWISRNIVCTPPVHAGALPGITRSVVQELCQRNGLAHEERIISAQDLTNTQGVFLTLSSKGIVPVAQINAAKIPLADEIKFLQQCYAERVARDCRKP